jgi:hypothetical protein
MLIVKPLRLALFQAFPPAAAISQPLDPSWPPVRRADFIASAGWVLAALAALVAASLLSAW